MHSFPSLRRARRWAAAALLAAALAAPPGGAQEPELSDLMARMDKAFGDLVKSLMLVSLQKLPAETPFEEAQQWAGEVAEIAKQASGTGTYKDAKAFGELARQAEGLARRLEGLAREKLLEDSVAALARLHAACARCHSEFRF